jgi:carboxymethylenebutenolidase
MAKHDTLASDLLGLFSLPFLSRRKFMTASAAAAAGYTLAAGLVSADAIHTSSDGLEAGDVAIQTADGTMPAYFARPAGVKNPPVIIVAMEIFGLHEYIKDVTRRIAKLGALAVAPDYYFRLGDLAKISDVQKLLPLVNSKPDSELISDLGDTVEWAKARGGDSDKLGIVGFCRGGRTVWIYSAASPAIKAGVAFYGSLVDPASQKQVWPHSPVELASEMKAPVLGLYAGKDQSIPVSQVETMKAGLASADKTADFKIYETAGHGFHADYRPSYDAAAATDAWTQMTAWFKRWSVLS